MADVQRDLLGVADELYGLAAREFTPARDARAKELKGTDLGHAVKALKKPSLAAWVVNLLVRRDTEQVDQVLAVGEALREAQAGDVRRGAARAHQAAAAADRGRHHAGPPGPPGRRAPGSPRPSPTRSRRR